VDCVRKLAELDALCGQFALPHEFCHRKNDGSFSILVPARHGFGAGGIQGSLIGSEPFSVRLVEKVEPEKFGFPDKAIRSGLGDFFKTAAGGRVENVTGQRFKGCRFERAPPKFLQPKCPVCSVPASQVGPCASLPRTPEGRFESWEKARYGFLPSAR